MAEVDVTVSVVEGTGVVDWPRPADAAGLERAVGIAADEALVGRGLRRLEASVPADDRMARRALHRAGFRLEGVRREADTRGSGEFGDVALYARLATDRVHDDGAFSAVMNSVLPRKRMIAHVVFRNAEGAVLYCETTFKKDWELPGGVVEPLEPPAEAARREIVEELGVELPVGRLLVADWMPPYLGWEDAFELIFDGGVLSPDQIATLVPDGREIARVHWMRPDDAEQHLIPLSARRLRLLLALSPGETLYTEAGRRV